MGTPKTLIEAIGQAQLMTNDAYDSQEILSIKKHIKDFLSQHFQTAMLQNPDCQTILLELFNRITK